MKRFIAAFAVLLALILSASNEPVAAQVAGCVPGFAGVQPANSTDCSNPPFSFTPQGASGISAAPQTVPVGSVAYGSFGNATTLVNGQVYVASLFVPYDMTVTNVNVLNAGTVGTNACIGILYNTAGSVIRTSALAGATTTGANAFQAYALTSPVAIQGPGRYFVGLQCNGTTDNFRSVAASTFVGVLTQSNSGTFGTAPGITPPTTFTANVGPIAYLN